MVFTSIFQSVLNTTPHRLSYVWLLLRLFLGGDVGRGLAVSVIASDSSVDEYSEHENEHERVKDCLDGQLGLEGSVRESAFEEVNGVDAHEDKVQSHREAVSSVVRGTQ